MNRPNSRLLAACACLSLLLGCQSTRHRFIFHPSPNEVLVQPDPSGGVVARALVSITFGERRATDGQPEMVVGLRLENNATGPIELLAQQSVLVGSDVRAFGPARLVGEPVAPIPVGAEATYELRFPYPEKLQLSARDLDGLNLLFSIEHPAGVAKATASFTRVFPEPEHATRSSFSFGFLMSR